MRHEISRDYLLKIIDSIADPIFVKDRQHRWVLLNTAFCTFMGRTAKEMLGRSDYEFFPETEAEVFWAKDEYVFLNGVANENEEGITSAQGVRRTIVTKKTLYQDAKGKKHIVGIIRDITGLKKAEDELRHQKTSLEQKNIALNEVLGQIEIEKQKIKDAVAANVQELVIPVIDQLKVRGPLKRKVNLLKKNMLQLMYSFGKEISDKKLRLTPREIGICNMIREGLANKEIASLQGVSVQTIEKHRAHIRKKLGLTNRERNLTTYLQRL